MVLLDKLAKIEALIERTTSEGERRAAQLAKERILERQKHFPKEFKISHQNIWKKKLFMALCQKYGLTPYRYKKQKLTTTRVQVSPVLMQAHLWPEYQKYVRLLEEAVDEVFHQLLSKIAGEELTLQQQHVESCLLKIECEGGENKNQEMPCILKKN